MLTLVAAMVEGARAVGVTVRTARRRELADNPSRAMRVVLVA
jgi:hypothetical protein